MHIHIQIHMHTTHTHTHTHSTELEVVKENTSTQITTAGHISQAIYEQWIKYLDASPKTVETYTRAIRQFFIFLQENKITQPTRDDIVAYRNHLRENHKPTTIQGYLAAVKLFFKWTAQEGLYPNISDRVKGAKLDREHKKDYLTTRQVNSVLETVDTSTLTGKRDYALLSLMVTTGLRTISITRANLDDIKTIGDSQALYYQGKGHAEKATYVKLAEPVEKAIYTYRAARGEKDGSKPLFTSGANRNVGGRMTTRSISRIAKGYLVKAGLDSDRLTAHSFRHTAATLNLLNGGTVEETQQLLDHANINTTLIYSHALERAKNHSEERIAKAIFG